MPQADRLRVAHLRVQADGRARVDWAWEGEWSAHPEQRLASLRTLRRLRKTRSRSVWVLGREQYRMVSSEAPEGVPAEGWRDALRWQLKGQVDFDVADASIDLLPLMPERGGARRAPLLAVLAPHAPLRPLVAQAQQSGWPMKAIDIPETALCALCERVAPAGRAQALLSFGGGVGSLVVTHDDQTLTLRQIEVEISALAGDDAARREAALDRVGLEVQRTLDSIDRVFSHLNLSRLLVVPGPGMAALIEHLRGLTFVPVLPFELGDAVDTSAVPELAGQASAAWLVALGAALREQATA